MWGPIIQVFDESYLIQCSYITDLFSHMLHENFGRGFA